jgi:hypothetical protein
MIRVRPYQPADRAFVLGLAPRLTIGMPPWRHSQGCIAAAQSWITGSRESTTLPQAMHVSEHTTLRI